MELYQAINECQDIEVFGIEGINPWFICPGFSSGSYIIRRNYSEALGRHYNCDDISSIEMIYIELKRGGIRQFKSLDAACNAVREIGQYSVEVVL